MTSHFGFDPIGRGPSSSSESAFLIRQYAVFFQILAAVDLKFLNLHLISINAVFRKCLARSSLHNTPIWALSLL